MVKRGLWAYTAAFHIAFQAARHVSRSSRQESHCAHCFIFLAALTLAGCLQEMRETLQVSLTSAVPGEEATDTSRPLLNSQHSLFQWRMLCLKLLQFPMASNHVHYPVNAQLTFTEGMGAGMLL